MINHTKSFELRIFSGQTNQGKCEFETKIEPSEWPQFLQVKLPGFDGSVSVSLEEFWASALQSNQTYYSQAVFGYETIIKFNNTQQLKVPYLVELKVEL